MSTTRNGARAAGSSAAGRADEGQRGLLLAGDDLGLDAEASPHHRRRSRRGCAASRVALVATIRTRSAPSVAARARRSRPAPARVRSIAAGASPPVRSTPWPRRTTSISRCTSVVRVGRRRRRRAGGSSWCRSRRRRPSRAGPLARHGVRVVGATHGPVGPPVPQPRERLVAERVDARAGGQACATSTCRHLTRSGMPPAPARPCSTSSRVAPGEVVVRGRGTARGSSGSVGQPAGHLPHQPVGLQRADRGREAGGRSGSTASGTGVPSSSRGAVSTTSGWPHGQRCATPAAPAAARPSWRPTTSGVARGRPARLTARRGRRDGRPRRRCPTAWAYQGASAAGRASLGGAGVPAAAVTTYGRLAGQDVVQPRARLGRDVRRGRPAARRSALERRDALAGRPRSPRPARRARPRWARYSRTGSAALTARDDHEHDEQRRGAAGRGRSATARAGRRAAASGVRRAAARAPAARGAGGRARTRPECRRASARRPRAGRRARPAGAGRPGTGRPRRASLTRASARPGSAGRRRRRRSGRRRRAPPRCAAAGCTWPPARSGPARRS